jgi:hypothetical protein
MSSEASQRLDWYDPKPPEPESASVVTEVAAPEAAPEAVTVDRPEPAAELTPEDQALIEEAPDGEEPAETDKSDKADEPAEGEAEPDKDDADAEPEAEATDKPTDSERPEDPEELAAWRKERGIPEEATGYQLPAVEDFEWREADAAALAMFGQAFVEADIPQSAVDKIVGVYADRLKALRDADKSHLTERRTALQEQWGDSYSPRIKAMKAYVEKLPFGKDLKHARLPNGKLLFNTEGAYEWLLAIAEARPKSSTPADRMAEIAQVRDTDIDRYFREGLDKELMTLSRKAEANPAPAVVESAGALQAEKVELEKLMNTDIDAYMNRPYRGTGKTASQRYLEIGRALAGRAA